MSFYNHKEIEPKWQGYWAEHHTFKTGTDASKPKFYALDMFPYPSGAGLHVGYPQPLQTCARLQCPSPNGLGCFWFACRAIRYGYW